MKALSSIDALMGPLALLLIMAHAYWYGRKKAKSNDLYKRYFTGAIIKMIGSLGFMAVYIFYYKEGGDTLDYHQNSKSLMNLMYYDFGNFWDVLWSSKPEYMSYFTGDTGYVLERHFVDPNTFNVARITTFFEVLCGGSYIGTCFLLSYLCYQGLWRLYRVFVEKFTSLRNGLFYAVLLVPSVVFWTGGISKEVYIIAVLGFAVFAIDRIFDMVKNRFVNIIILIMCLYLFISIKPYVFVAFFPAIMAWVVIANIQKISNRALRFLIAPIVTGFSIVLSVFIWYYASSFLGEYASVDAMIEKALITQQDLQHERYDGSSFDIGAFEPKAEGALRKFPQAVSAGLFRPYIFEAKNVVMLFSSIENLVLVVLALLAMIRPRKLIRIASTSGIVTMAIVFSMIFAFAIGLSTSNFGALVRLKVPLLPLFFGALFIVAKSMGNRNKYNSFR